MLWLNTDYKTLAQDIILRRLLRRRPKVGQANMDRQGLITSAVRPTGHATHPTVATVSVVPDAHIPYRPSIC